MTRKEALLKKKKKKRKKKKKKKKVVLHLQMRIGLLLVPFQKNMGPLFPVR